MYDVHGASVGIEKSDIHGKNVCITEIRVTRHARYVLASVRISPPARHEMSRADDKARVVQS